MAEFKVGGHCVCVDDKVKVAWTANLPIKKGLVYPVNAISYSPCCNAILLDIGVKTNATAVCCNSCNKIFKQEGDIFWLLASRFLPLDDFQQVTFTKILESVPMGAQ